MATLKEKLEKLTPEQRTEFEAELAEEGFVKSDGSLAKTVEKLQEQVADLLKERKRGGERKKSWLDDIFGV